MEISYLKRLVIVCVVVLRQSYILHSALGESPCISQQMKGCGTPCSQENLADLIQASLPQNDIKLFFFL